MTIAETTDRQPQGERAYNELRDRLVLLRIGPGQPIDEGQVAGELAVGRTSVREALSRLAVDGLVTSFPGRGTFASTITIADLTHICDERLALEVTSPVGRPNTPPCLTYLRFGGSRAS